MPLFVPKSSSHPWRYDNWGANPSATIGTSVTPGASNVKGSWAQLASGANIAVGVTGVYFQIHTGATAGSAKNHLLDIGIDPAGGSSYTAIISDLDVGSSPALTAAGNREYFFPIAIPSGASVAARAQGSAATAGTLRVAARFYGQPTAPEALPVGSFTETLGAVTASSRGTTFTPGNAADGSWVNLGTTVNPMWWWQLGYGIDNTVVTAEYTYIDLAWGDGSTYNQIFQIMHSGTTNETAGLAAQTSLTWHSAYCPVPAGAGIYVRGRCNNSPDTGYHANAIGLG